ncbi:hypothetical protein [Kitasatospora viridis]|uniref:Elongation factor G-like protein n=1 Tax=Kitasatospora viridis TaxID=281105 RepID=A0A561T687_9ACTN|nr:hypothetical protein [Kitasatospora viridis]TWF82626.1 elongation factor G-like protein [Kitasatospora viridis]
MPGVRDYPQGLDRPIRDVQAQLSGRGGLRPFAFASADFEPLPADRDPALPTFEFVNEVPEAELPAEFGAAFGEGVHRQLRSWSYGETLPYAVLVRLRHARWRAGESTAAGFTTAGQQAAHEFSECFHHRVGPRRLLSAQGPTTDAPAAVRDVHVRLVNQTMCGHFAIATADFEPLPADGELLFEFVNEVPEEQLPLDFADAFERGLREELYATPDGRLPLRAFRVRLHDARWHEVDSNERVFKAAGRKAAAEALGRS